MKVHELMELLSSMSPDAEVRLANQPNWPLQHGVRGAVSVADLVEHVVWNGDPADGGCEEHGDLYCRECITKELNEEHGDVVWLVEGSLNYDDSPYAPRAIWDVV